MVTNDQIWERGDLFDPNCATRVVLDRIGDKWTALVLPLAGPEAGGQACLGDSNHEVLIAR